MHNDFLIEVWSRLKPYINTKDRMDAADAFVAVIDEHAISDDIEEQIGSISDKHLKAALVSRYGYEDQDDDEDDTW